MGAAIEIPRDRCCCGFCFSSSLEVALSLLLLLLPLLLLFLMFLLILSLECRAKASKSAVGSTMTYRTHSVPQRPMIEDCRSTARTRRGVHVPAYLRVSGTGATVDDNSMRGLHKVNDDAEELLLLLMM